MADRTRLAMHTISLEAVWLRVNNHLADVGVSVNKQLMTDMGYVGTRVAPPTAVRARRHASSIPV